MSAWTALLPAATVGTDRQPGPWPLPPGDIGALARQAAEGAEPATGLLRAAAVLATCALAGAQGPLWAEPLPAAAPDDTLPALALGPVFGALTQVLFDGPQRLQHEAFLILARAGLRLPANLLPQALELGRRSIALRAPLLAVLGERGLWLAAQRADWGFAAGISEAESNDEAAWTDGTLEQRRAWFTQARQADPAAARERLKAALPELPARERADLVAALATGLGPNDEALLDPLRNDRSREVRQAALQLLLRLPEAAHPQRAAARLAPLLTFERGLLRKRWVIEAPTAPGSDWKADQLDATRPQQHALGERAWWLYQLVGQVPLAWWRTHTGMTPAELLAWAAGTDWTEALVRGWADVLFAAPDDAWCDALLDHWPPGLREDPARVLGLLAPAARDRHLLRYARSGSQPAATVLSHALHACPPGQVLSAELSGLLARALQAQVRDGALNTDYGLRGSLTEFACAAHADSLDTLAALPRRADETPSCAEALLTVERIVSARRALHTLTPTRTP
ncbi:DUF5691 domain-containing protein [Roseateles sp. P5_E8]